MTIWPSAAVPRVISDQYDTLDGMKSAVCLRIDYDAEEHREALFSPGAAQMFVYIEKHAQAGAVDEMGEAAANALPPDQIMAQFPLLAASIGFGAVTLWGTAQLVIHKYETTIETLAKIELARLSGKHAVSSAVSEADVLSALAGVRWPT